MLRGLWDRFFIKQPRLRELVTRTLYGSEDRDVKLVGLRLTVNALRENGYLRAAIKTRASSFLEDEVNILLTLMAVAGRCDGFVDIGANVGIFSVAVGRLRRLDPNFRITAFEPHPDTYLRLAANTKRFDVATHNVALSSREGELAFVDGAVSHVFTAEAHANAYSIKNRTINVQTRRLDSFEFHERALLLKIDVEGQEHDVLLGAERLFNENRVAAVYFDGHDQKGVPAFLKSRGFRLFDIQNLDPTTGNNFNLLALRAGLWTTR